MRRFVLIPLVLGATACTWFGSTGPDGTVIGVRLLDDRGASAGRNQVVVQLPERRSVNAITGRDGTVDIGVAGAGTYDVRVIPRDGFIATEFLSKRVTVTARGKTVVEFILMRGAIPPEPPWTGW